MTNTKPAALTPAMATALEIARTEGAVLAGETAVKGRVRRVSASALRGLERRGLIVLTISPDGGMMGRPA